MALSAQLPLIDGLLTYHSSSIDAMANNGIFGGTYIPSYAGLTLLVQVAPEIITCLCIKRWVQIQVLVIILVKRARTDA